MLAVMFMALVAGSTPLKARPKTQAQEPRHVKVVVTEKGFEPSQIDAKAGEKLVLDVTRTTDSTCAKRILVPDQKVDVEMPLNQPVEVAVDASKPGTIRFGCQMGLMMHGDIVVK
jgi:plastocyanin domain-containing protein